MRSAINVLLSLGLIFQGSGCVRVISSRHSEDAQVTKERCNLERNPELTCQRAFEDMVGCPENGRCPDVVYTAARCHLEGVGGTPMDIKKGRELMEYAASCGVIPAQEQLQSIGIPIPSPMGSLGYRILPPYGIERRMCGVKDEVTAVSLLGAIVVVPVLIVAGVGLAVVAFIAVPPYCGARYLFTSGSCLDDLKSGKSNSEAAG